MNQWDGLCINCRQLVTGTLREVFFSSCLKCLRQIDRRVKKSGWKLDYSSAYLHASGLTAIPGKKGKIRKGAFMK